MSRRNTLILGSMHRYYADPRKSANLYINDTVISNGEYASLIRKFELYFFPNIHILYFLENKMYNFCQYKYFLSNQISDQYIWNFTFTVLKMFQLRCLMYNGYHCRKGTWQPEFESWTKLFAFHIALTPLRKVWHIFLTTGIQLGRLGSLTLVWRPV